MDIITQLGELALGSRLKRLSDQIMQDGVSIYQAYKIDFNPVWFPVFYAISQHEQIGVMDVAEAIKFSHPHVIKTARALEKKGYIFSFKDDKDKRKRWLALTEEGRALLPEMEKAWNDIAASISQILQSNSQHLLQAVGEVEGAFQEASFLSRVKAIRNERLLEEIEILAYRDDLKDHFKTINYAWIEKYFKIEDIDRKILEHPQDQIIDKGGAIFFAAVDGQIAGTCALKPEAPGVFELSKMGVRESFQGRQIGKKLGLAAIQKAKALKANILFLESNKKLGPALQLYYRLGFKQVPMNKLGSEYERANIRMEMQL